MSSVVLELGEVVGGLRQSGDAARVQSERARPMTAVARAAWSSYTRF
jgi:hypothetical protein